MTGKQRSNNQSFYPLGEVSYMNSTKAIFLIMNQIPRKYI